LLKVRQPGDPVPVVVSVGSWDPRTPLREWLGRWLVRDYPGLGGGGRPGGAGVAARAGGGGMGLPVLDGFDESAGACHAAALRALNAMARMPLVLTSRVYEYAAAVADGDVLTGAAVVELDDLTVDDLADYLPRTRRDAGDGGSVGVWEPVVARLRAHA